VKTNDSLLVIYLSSLIRSVIALHNLIVNKLQYREAEKKADGGKEEEKKEDKKGEGEKKEGEKGDKKEGDKGKEGEKGKEKDSKK
jgi:26S proteasome regulatory subunit N8